MSFHSYFHDNVYCRHEINKQKKYIYTSRAERECARDQFAGARSDVRCLGYGAEEEGKKGERRVIKNTDDSS